MCNFFAVTHTKNNQRKVLHKPIQKNWNASEFKPHGLSLEGLAREGITVIHTSASHFPIQSLSLGRLPKHFTSKLSVPTPFIIETWSFTSSQKFLINTGEEKFRRRKMPTAPHRWDSKERSGGQPSPSHTGTGPIRWDLSQITAAGSFKQSFIGQKHKWRGSTWSHPQHPTWFWSPHTMVQLLQGKDRHLPWHAIKLNSSYTKS